MEAILEFLLCGTITCGVAIGSGVLISRSWTRNQRPVQDAHRDRSPRTLQSRLDEQEAQSQQQARSDQRIES